MMFTGKILPLFTLTIFLFLSGNVYGANTYDREITVKNDTRALAVEEAFKELLAAYEDEDPIGFLDRVSDERFRQDYMTFTDAMYTDFRTYDIHRVDYWIDRVVADNIKQFVWVRWEKRYESFTDGQQFTTTGYSRFLFDEINGKYLLIELAGNNLFGGSLQEWRDEVPQIVGQEAEPVVDDLPDLVVEDVLLTGGSVSSVQTLTFVVRNIGTAPSSSCQVSADNTTLTNTTVSPLEPNEEQHFKGIFSGSSSGSIRVDSSNEVKESDENNNTAEIE